MDRYPPEKEINWGDELSLGEQQRLGMARLFYHKPKFAILDECTSAVTTDMEERFCAKVHAMGTSCITISHRPALVAFHDVVLSLDGEGGWSVHYKRLVCLDNAVLFLILWITGSCSVVLNIKDAGRILLSSLKLEAIGLSLPRQNARMMQWLSSEYLQPIQRHENVEVLSFVL